MVLLPLGTRNAAPDPGHRVILTELDMFEISLTSIRWGGDQEQIVLLQLCLCSDISWILLIPQKLSHKCKPGANMHNESNSSSFQFVWHKVCKSMILSHYSHREHRMCPRVTCRVTVKTENTLKLSSDTNIPHEGAHRDHSPARV